MSQQHKVFPTIVGIVHEDRLSFYSANISAQNTHDNIFDTVLEALITYMFEKNHSFDEALIHYASRFGELPLHREAYGLYIGLESEKVFASFSTVVSPMIRNAILINPVADTPVVSVAHLRNNGMILSSSITDEKIGEIITMSLQDMIDQDPSL